MRRQRSSIAAAVVMMLAAAACSGEGSSPPSSSAPGTTAPPPAAVSSTTSAATGSGVPETTTTLAASATEPMPTPVEAVTASLRGLSFDAFVEASFEALVARSPQWATEVGIAGRLGLRKDRLDDLSDGFGRETMAIEAALLEMLHGYDRAGLDHEQQITYDVYEWYLDDLVRGHPFVYHDYLVHHMLGSYHWSTFFYFTESFPLLTPEDAEDYVAAVALVGVQAGQVLDGLEIREELGIFPPDFITAMARGAMLGQLEARSPDPSRVDPTRIGVYTRFEEDTAAIEGLDSARRDSLLADLERAITESLVPGWMDLIDYLEHLATVAGPEAGVWKLPDGDAYYAYMLHKETSTDLTPEEIHRIGLAEVERIRGDLRSIFDELGYPAGESLSDSMARILADGGTIDTRTTGPDTVVDAYLSLLSRVEPVIEPVFNLRPAAPLTIVPDPSFGGGGGFYAAGSLDGSRPGAFYTGSAPGIVSRYDMATILHHEGVPGHHFQIALAQELGLPLVRSVFHNNGYVEGWALYAEYLVKELGVYEGDPYGDAGRLHLELLRAVRLVTDTGIHSMGWNRQEAEAYMVTAMGGWTHEVDRYIVLPAQATGYKIGMLEILRLRALAEEELGDAFDLAAFHDVVIGHGSVPLDVLERLIEEWIERSRP
jgi:uncharacterized protein (DUF885 family)